MCSRIAFYFILSLSASVVYSQEWKSLRSFQKETGLATLKAGCWLKKDRQKKTATWIDANKHNLSLEKSHHKYTTITQIRDFYTWLDTELKKQGHGINTPGVVAIVARQLSYFDNYFIRKIIVRNKQIIWFGNEGAKKVFEFAFPLFKEVYTSTNLLTGKKATEWDLEYVKIEQCEIVEKLYKQLSEKSLQKLERMAKGKALFRFGVPRQLTYEGDITNCQSRYEHTFTKVYPYYLTKQDK